MKKDLHVCVSEGGMLVIMQFFFFFFSDFNGISLINLNIQVMGLPYALDSWLLYWVVRMKIC